MLKTLTKQLQKTKQTKEEAKHPLLAERRNEIRFQHTYFIISRTRRQDKNSKDTENQKDTINKLDLIDPEYSPGEHWRTLQYTWNIYQGRSYFGP